jgi:hypothetical protein
LATLAALTALGPALVVGQVLIHVLHVHVFVVHSSRPAAVTMAGLAAVLLHLFILARAALSLALFLLALALLATLLGPLMGLAAILLLLAIALLAGALGRALTGALALVPLIAVLVPCHLFLL